ncbi:hypothetical protein ACGFS9_02890 [Streptomyces sp. NPDC048566]|uniref:hypothetical protein n=1 Tax=Streptomyces sp. NPDC048566 TaxID=3365569 RepID=UPI00371605A6
MNAKLVNSAAGVINAALTQDRTAAGIALALESAQLLLTPETVSDLAALRERNAQLEAAAVEARAALGALCFDLEDPGSAALGALHLLAQATPAAPDAKPDDATRVLAQRDGAVLRQAAEDLMAPCPEHGDSDEVWMDCPCEYAEELVRRAQLLGGRTS